MTTQERVIDAAISLPLMVAFYFLGYFRGANSMERIAMKALDEFKAHAFKEINDLREHLRDLRRT